MAKRQRLSKQASNASIDSMFDVAFLQKGPTSAAQLGAWDVDMTRSLTTVERHRYCSNIQNGLLGPTDYSGMDTAAEAFRLGAEAICKDTVFFSIVRYVKWRYFCITCHI